MSFLYHGLVGVDDFARRAAAVSLSVLLCCLSCSVGAIAKSNRCRDRCTGAGQTAGSRTNGILSLRHTPWCSTFPASISTFLSVGTNFVGFQA